MSNESCKLDDNGWDALKQDQQVAIPRVRAVALKCWLNVFRLNAELDGRTELVTPRDLMWATKHVDTKCQS